MAPRSPKLFMCQLFLHEAQSLKTEVLVQEKQDLKVTA